MSSLAQPISKAGLYQNLLYISSYRRPSAILPRLVSYHDSFSDRPNLYSTRSFNFLISLAIRHAAFGTAGRLLAAMRARGMQDNLETWKLKIRWLIRLGRWSDAWRQALRTFCAKGSHSAHLHVLSPVQGKEGMPLSIWMEFFGTVKRGAIRSRKHQGGGRLDPAGAADAVADRTASEMARFKMLMQHFPSLTLTERSKMPARVVYLAVQMMLRMEEWDAAMTLTKVYLKSLPRDIDGRCVRNCVDIIHLHTISSRKRALSAHYTSRKTVNSLLGLHPRLRPNSTTVLLLLRHLKQTKRCGTIAQKFVSDFGRQWGSEMVDQRVRRRVASLALKEGRMDIVEAMLETERLLDWPRQLWGLQNDVLGGERRSPGRLRRRSAQKMFEKRGKETRRWKDLNRRFWRRLKEK